MARIGIDVDGVLRNYPQAVVNAFKMYMPEVVTGEEVTGYAFPNIDLPWERKAHLIFNEWAAEIYRHAPTMPSVQEGFAKLRKWANKNGHELVCVTNNQGQLSIYTLEWLCKHNLYFYEYHFLPHDGSSNFRTDKAGVPLDYLVDDSPKVYETWVEAKGDDSRFILMDHSYNRGVQARWRVSSLLNVISIMEGKAIPDLPDAFLLKLSPTAHDEGTVLDRARSLVFGDRGKAYGPPKEDFACAAAMYSAYISHKYNIKLDLKAADWPPALICTKLSRLANRFKMDSLDDIAGYAQTWEMVMGDD